jgi:hypothetical protein
MLPFSPQGRHIALALPHLPTLALAIGLSSCVPIPIDFEDEKLFQAEQVDFIEIGKSSKADISAAIFHLAEEMGETGVNKDLTPREYEDGKWWLYSQRWSSDRWMFLPLYPDIPYVSGNEEYRFLLINFDDSDIVVHYEMSTLQRDGCNRSGICKEGSELILLGRWEDIQLANEFDGPVDKCGVYLYTEADFALPIERNGFRVGRLIDDEHFLYWQLDPATYELKSLSLDGLNRGPIEFDCAVGEVYFFDFQPRKKGAGVRRRIWIEIEERERAEGRNAIDSRQLMLGVAPLVN